MSMTIDVFAGMLREKQKNGASRAALLLGFDGSSVLLSHPPAGSLVSALTGDGFDAAAGNLRISAELWNRKASNEQKREVMKSQTTPEGVPDEVALRYLAELIRGRYVTCVVATDSAGELYNRLRALDVEMERFSCATYRRTILSQLPSRMNAAVFIDGGELLLEGCEPDSYGASGSDLRDMERALHDFLNNFDDWYCWGWSSINQQITFVCPDRPGLFTLGAYTSNQVRSRFAQEVRHDADQPDTVSTVILHAIGARLFGTIDVTPPPEPVDDRTELYQRPLLPINVLSDLRDQVAHTPIMVIGIEGEAVRHSSTEWLVNSLRQEGRRVRTPNTGVADKLAMYLSLAADPDDDLCLVGNVLGEQAAPISYEILLHHLQRWKDASRHATSAARRIVLLGPRELATLTGDWFPGDEVVRTVAVFIHHWLTPGLVSNWLVRTLDPRLSPADADILAEIMVTDSRKYEADAADWLIGMLDIWTADVDRVGREHLDGAPTAAELAQSWEKIRDRYTSMSDELADVGSAAGPGDADPAARTAGVVRTGDVDRNADRASAGQPAQPDLDFDVTPVRRRDREPAVVDDDFDLGPIVALPMPAESDSPDDNGDADGA